MIRFKVTPVDGSDPYEIVATSRDVLLWEKTTKGKAFQELMERLAMVDMYKIAHFAAKREGRFTGPLSEWEESVDLVPEVEVEEGGPDPTQSGA